MNKQMNGLYTLFLNGYRIGDEAKKRTQRGYPYNEWTYVKGTNCCVLLWYSKDYWILRKYKI